jgi:signal transduction histidine kinase
VAESVPDESLLDLEETPVLVRLLSSRRPLWIDNLMQTGDALTPIMYFGLQQGMQAYAGAPIIARGRVLGFLNMYARQAKAFGESASRRLLAFAEQAAIALENARLFQQAAKLAATEERQRLARDLHDSVSQTLFTTSALAESALRQWENNPAKAYQLLHDVYRMSQAAQAEMRVLLLELRPHTITSMGLHALVTQLVRPIHARRGLDVQVSIPEKLVLPAAVQIGLYRIVQEALNNIEKHALASQVQVSLISENDCTMLRIADNGQGFDVDNVREGSMGLGIMSERAQSLGGALSLASMPGEGTTIVVTLNNAALVKDED